MFANVKIKVQLCIINQEEVDKLNTKYNGCDFGQNARG